MELLVFYVTKTILVTCVIAIVYIVGTPEEKSTDFF